ncbi:acireductone dioxygenase [Pseudomonas umsongensis]|jgi:1,2-dihydroxy-3-keto-5-methylthiopentene dioxygenase|uniref:acireductone dioxygenase n=1 Tax=Pseudomonas umsongensis TaxID=198618 RepID=UPI0015BC9243|nr:acireductone dioxygenase [Pseudomonas umsongensis]NWL18380.1 acireductone dioxygenase [Pseudomonas umsongensis]
MSSLSVYHVSSPDVPNKVLTHFEDIASTLAEQGVRFDHWQATAKIRPGASHEDVISACQAPIDTLMTQHGLRAIDVISLDRDHPQKESIRASFFAEHRQDETEVMLFSAGSALLSVYIDDYVYAVLCEKGDLIVLPAGTRQWLDIGEQPYVVAIRLSSSQPWVAHFTDVDNAGRFPRMDD